MSRQPIRHGLGLALCAALCFMACATPTTPRTEYGYSRWVSRHGVNSKGEFERVRNECLQQHRIEDPAAVERESPTDLRFSRCMRVKGWCSNDGSCR
jgi:hypothetical protein